MKKMQLLLATLLLAFCATAFAQDVTTWDGKNKSLTFTAGDSTTYEYTATEKGYLYIYSDDQNINSNPLSLYLDGGLWTDGAFNEDAPIEDTGFYDSNGAGFYGRIKVFPGDVIRFSLKAVGEEGVTSRCTMKSILFALDMMNNQAGATWEDAIELPKGENVMLPVNLKSDYDYAPENFDNITYCKMTAEETGVASIYTTDYIVYYVETEKYGSEPLQRIVQSQETNDHEFIVEAGKEYIIVFGNTRPISARMKMITGRKGAHPIYPIEITETTTALDLVSGDNWYKIDINKFDKNNFMTLTTAAYAGSLEVLEDNRYMVLPEHKVNMAANSTLYRDLDVNQYNSTGYLYINLPATETMNEAATLVLREPKDGETCSLPVASIEGTTTFDAEARLNWFTYTCDKDAIVTITSTAGNLARQHNDCSSSNRLVENTFRMYKDETIMYAINATAAKEDATVTITCEDVVPGDYCDVPVDFTIGEDITFADRGDGVNNYRRFTAEKDGIVTITTTCETWIEYGWSFHAKNDCDAANLTFTYTDGRDMTTGATARTYHLTVTEGQSYILELTTFVNGGEDIVATTAYQTTGEGDLCSNPILITDITGSIAAKETVDSETWYGYQATASGFYTLDAEVGQGGNIVYKLGDCDAKETTVPGNSALENNYMLGLKQAKIYVEEGQLLLFRIKIKNAPAEGRNYHFTLTFNEAREGEMSAKAIALSLNQEVNLPYGEGAFATWYKYVIPAQTELVIDMTTGTFTQPTFYQEDATTALSAYKKEFTNTMVKNDANEMTGRNFVFPAQDTERTLYIMAPVFNDEAKMFIGGMTGIQGIEEHPMFSVYPNPAAGEFFVECATAGVLYVTSLNGTVVYKTAVQEGTNHVSLNGIARGMYLVTVGDTTVKLIVK